MRGTRMMKRQQLFLVLLLLCLPLPCLAECVPCDVEPDPEAWKKSIAAGFNFTDGNSESSLLNLRVKASREKGKDVWIFDVEQGWGETTNIDTQEEETVADFTQGLAAYRHLLNKNWYVGTRIDALRDAVANVKYRVTPGAALGRYLLKQKGLQLSLEAGPAYVLEEVGGVQDDYWAPQISDRFEWAISKTATLFQTTTVTFDVNEAENYLIQGEAGVTAALTSMLNLVLSVTDSYDNVPAADKKRNDIAVISALSINL